MFFFFSSRRRHTRLVSDWSSDVCSSDLDLGEARKPRPHDEPLPVAGKLTRELLEEPRPDRARADERHVAPEHVPELRRSEERRVGKEGRARGASTSYKKAEGEENDEDEI